ncbi:RNA-binding protein lark isoform X1 [Bicyclus anynana]|uniref:RNA-binding protein lark isoform X1 n=1 Tax=Bicyclus anynana TaxID=110368 RepID=A0A6J1NTM7_BICAN|nr:RNA-binding protein lark isoform X1 [Bicyclus anynana]
MVAQTKVFVGRLPEDAKPEELRKLFERFGVVTECDVMNRCGFVHMETEEQAAAAIRDLHNTTFNGGVITVERGRIKERGQRGGRGMRGGMRGGMDRRGGMRGGMRDAPYPMRDRGMGPMRDRGMGHMRSAAPYDRGMERAPMGSGGYDDRYNGYGGEDRRGFALMDGRGARDAYSAPPPMYADDRQGYGAPVEHNMYPDERDMIDRRAPMRSAPMAMSSGYDRAAPRAAPMGTDMYSRRSDQSMGWGGAAAAGSYERDPYAQQYPQAGRIMAPG